jgi:hypothetical protein
MSDSPSPAADNGRDGAGRFTFGNRLGRGNPHHRRIQRIRAALMRAADPKEIEKAARKLVADAVAGDRLALAELLDRTIGRAIPMDLEERLSRLEAFLEERQAR